MATPDQQAVDQILRRRRPEPQAYRESGLYAYQDLATWAPEALALAPVGIAAAVESYVRDTIRELVDAGNPFVDRVDKLKLRTQPGIEAMKALHGRRISLGEWVSHLVRVSSIPHLDDHLCALFSAPNLRTLLAGIRYFSGPTPSDFGVTWDGEPSSDVLESDADDGKDTEEAESLVVVDPARVIASLGRLFEARHRAAHESGPPALDLATLTLWADDAQTFCTALSNLVEITLRPLEPFSTPMMELKAGTELDRECAELSERLEQLYTRLSALPPLEDHRDLHWSGLPFISPAEFADLARRAQEAYAAYEEAELDFQAYYWPDGTGWKTWRMEAELDLVKERSRRVAQSLHNADEMFAEEDLPGDASAPRRPMDTPAAEAPTATPSSPDSAS